jgi:hypothetical protein
MTETIEETGGFDRRSLIKKGLVIGGAAAVLPVISTFNAPAFAVSPPLGTVTRAKFNILASIGIGNIIVGVITTEVTPDATNPCGVTGWATATNAPGGTVSHSSLLDLNLHGSVRYTSATCTFTAGSITEGCTAGVISNGGHQIDFDLGAVDVNLLQQAYLVLLCP